MMYYIYRFLNEDNEIIYVGKTKNIHYRMKQHFGGSGHLSSECYEETSCIEYLSIKTKIDMDIRELYYINQFKPKHNTQNKQKERLTTYIDFNDQWELYKSRNEETIKELEEELKKHQEQVSILEENIKNTKDELRNIKIENTYLKNCIKELEKPIEFHLISPHNKNKSDNLIVSFEELKRLYDRGFSFQSICSVFANGTEKYRISINKKENELFATDLLSGKHTIISNVDYNYLLKHQLKMNWELHGMVKNLDSFQLDNAANSEEMKKAIHEIKMEIKKEQEEKELFHEKREYLYNTKDFRDVWGEIGPLLKREYDDEFIHYFYDNQLRDTKHLKDIVLDWMENHAFIPSFQKNVML